MSKRDGGQMCDFRSPEIQQQTDENLKILPEAGDKVQTVYTM